MSKLAALAALIVAAVLTAAPARRGSLEVGPIRMQMFGPERTATLTVRNAATTPVSVQIRTVDWTQPEGSDLYAPSSVLMVSPPLVTLDAGETQIVRVVVEGMTEARTERAFRLILDELPSASDALPAGVTTTLRILVPVFVTPSTESRADLVWSATQGDGQLTLTAANQGSTRERLINLQLSAGGRPIGDPLDGYVLAGGRRIWTVDTGSAPVSAVTVSAEGEYGTVQADVPVTP